MPLLEQKLDTKWAEGVMHEKVRLLLAVIHELEQKGREIAKDIEAKSYADLDEYFRAHDAKNSALIKLEGDSRREGNFILLKNCPMKSLLGKTSKGGTLPMHFAQIVDKWKQIYKSKGAVLHPYCIVHQVIRAQIAERMDIGGRKGKIYQIACASSDGSMIAFADEGLNKYKLTPEAAKKMIEGNACMYGIETSII